MKYTQELIDITLDQAMLLMNQGKTDKAQAYYIRAIALMLRNSQEPIVNSLKLY